MRRQGRGTGAAAIDPLREAFREGAAHPERGRPFWATMTVLAVAAAVGTAAVAALIDPVTGFATRLVERPVPLGEWALEWSRRAEPPAAEQQRQVLALSRVAAGIGALVTLLATVLVLALWRQRLRLRAHEYALHRALGARRMQRASRLAGEAAPWGAGASLAALVLAALLPAVVRSTFPGVARPSPGVFASLILLAGLGALLLNLDVRAGGSTRRSRAGTLLQAPLSSSPAAIVALGFAALTGVGLLGKHAPHVSTGRGAGGEVLVLAASVGGLPAPARGDALASWLEATRAAGFDVGLAGAGTVRGAGVRDMAWTDCGSCSEGGLPLPVHAVRVEVFAVAPDTFPLLGMALLSGRDFGAEPDGSLPGGVAIVTRSLAARHFERGDAVARQIRVGESAWMTVVGIVDDPPGRAGRAAYAVYLPVDRAQPAEVELILARPPSAPEAAVPLGPGVTLGPARTLAETYAVHAWFRSAIGMGGALALLLVFVGTWISAADEARALRWEIALRKAVGARPRPLRRFAAAAGARQLAAGLGIGAWLSLFLGAGLERAYGALPQVDAAVWAGTAALVTVAFLLGGAPQYRRALAAPPVEELRETGAT